MIGVPLLLVGADRDCVVLGQQQLPGFHAGEVVIASLVGVTRLRGAWTVGSAARVWCFSADGWPPICPRGDGGANGRTVSWASSLQLTPWGRRDPTLGTQHLGPCAAGGRLGRLREMVSPPRDGVPQIVREEVFVWAACDGNAGWVRRELLPEPLVQARPSTRRGMSHGAGVDERPLTAGRSSRSGPVGPARRRRGRLRPRRTGGKIGEAGA